MNFRQIFFTALLSSFVTAFLFIGVLSFGLFPVNSDMENLKNSLTEENFSESDANKTLSSEEDVLVAMIERTNPAVVSIVAKKDMPIYKRYYEESPLDLWGWFGGIPVPKTRELGTEEKEVGGGSGFVVDENGLVVTNRHVVDDNEAKYSIIFSDGETYDAEILGRDAVLDIAVLKIVNLEPEKKIPFLTFGSSVDLKLGQKVVAIGNALAEFRNSVSVGVVSGLSRTIIASDGQGASESLEQVIQTDAAINPGNSGGPLLNLKGEVIGVNVATSRSADNIGFALPVDAVKGIVSSVQKNGKIIRPFIGVRYKTLTPDFIKNNNLKVEYGALVSGGQKVGEVAILPNSPAEKAGIKVDDVIVAVDGESLKNKSLSVALRGKEIGKELVLTIIRGEEKIEKVLIPEEAPEL